MKANPLMILTWANRKRCMICRHSKDEGHILPSREKDKINPSAAWMFHYEDTHGFPHDMAIRFIWNSVYGLPTHLEAIAK